MRGRSPATDSTTTVCTTSTTCTTVMTEGLVSNEPVTTCTTVMTEGLVSSEPVTSCTTFPVPGCSSNGYGYGSGTAQQQQPYTTITSGSIVYVMMPGSGAAAGQVTNGVIVASAAKRFWYHDGILITNSLALTLILLALILM